MGRVNCSIAKKAPPAKANGAKSREETPKRGGGKRPTHRHHRSLGDAASIDGTCRPQREAAHTAGGGDAFA
jgi:hypothetical protein